MISGDQTATALCLISSKRRLTIITFVRLFLTSLEFKNKLEDNGSKAPSLIYLKKEIS